MNVITDEERDQIAALAKAGKGIRAIARETGCSNNTVKRWLHELGLARSRSEGMAAHHAARRSKAIPTSEEARENRSTALRAAHAAKPERREKMSGIMRAKWQDPEWRARQETKLRETCRRPEIRAKVSASRREAGISGPKAVERRELIKAVETADAGLKELWRQNEELKQEVFRLAAERDVAVSRAEALSAAGGAMPEKQAELLARAKVAVGNALAERDEAKNDVVLLRAKVAELQAEVDRLTRGHRATIADIARRFAA